MTLEHGISGFILAADDGPTIGRFAAEVAPATRAMVAKAREAAQPRADSGAQSG